jgi:hypothetical protein
MLRPTPVPVAVFATACLVMAAVACVQEEAQPGGDQTAKPQRIVQAIPGTVAEAEGIRITFLEKVEPWTAYGQFGEPPAGNVYVAVKIAMENAGKRDHNLSASNFALKTSGFDGEVTYSKAEPDLFAAGPFPTLSKGSRVEGWVTFTVAQGTQLKLLKYDPDPVTTDDIEFHFQGDGAIATATAQVAVPKQQQETPQVTPTTPPPAPYRMGDVATIAPYADTRFSLTLLWWRESSIAVNGPYSGNDYYTFAARPDTKFVVLAFRFRNDWKSPLETPRLAGTVITDRGYEFPAWSPPLGVHSEEYSPRPSSQEELQALPGNAAAYEELFPEQESGLGALVFEVPADQSPTSVQLSYVDRPVILGE